ncbi:MAG TPA: hypothetical protein VIP29_06105 [Nitrososphaeraceae archaeon]
MNKKIIITIVIIAIFAVFGVSIINDFNTANQKTLERQEQENIEEECARQYGNTTNAYHACVDDLAELE